MMLLEMMMTGAVLVFVWSSPASSDPALTLLPSNSALTAQHCFESPEICKYWHWNCGEFMQNFVWFLCLFLAWLRMSKNLSVLCPEPMFPCFNVKVWELWHLGLEHSHINTVPQSRWHFTNYSPLQLAEPLPQECIMYCTEEGKMLRLKSNFRHCGGLVWSLRCHYICSSLDTWQPLLRNSLSQPSAQTGAECQM